MRHFNWFCAPGGGITQTVVVGCQFFLVDGGLCNYSGNLLLTLAYSLVTIGLFFSLYLDIFQCIITFYSSRLSSLNCQINAD